MDVQVASKSAEAQAKVTYGGEYDENGVDVSLIRYVLGLSPVERLSVMERHAQDTLTLMEYGRRHREAKTRTGG
jgi:hypothetical protein